MEFETKAIRLQTAQTSNREHSSPLYLTSSFTFEDAEQMRAIFAEEEEGNIYSRFVNPNSTEFIDKMCQLEGAEAGFATASGMAAVFAGFMALLKTGDHILSASSIFGSTHSILSKILPKYGITHSYADMNKPETWELLIRKETKMIFVETPSNPGLEMIDLEWLSTLSKKHGLILNVDNCFATPFIQRPIEWGADLVTHSATKYIDGQGRVMGGIILGRKDLIKEIHTFCRSTGPALSPFNAWILSKSLETLALRMERHSENALKLAEFLQGRNDIEKLRYPFLPSHPQHAIAMKQMSMGGGIVSFELKGGLAAGKKFLNALQMCSLTANLGDSRTIATHPASTTHAKLTEQERLDTGITPGLVRISVGLENIKDILKDVETAMGFS
jgi:O-succinylhomoserine sulfhydrylase